MGTMPSAGVKRGEVDGEPVTIISIALTYCKLEESSVHNFQYKHCTTVVPEMMKTFKPHLRCLNVIVLETKYQPLKKQKCA